MSKGREALGFVLICSLIVGCTSQVAATPSPAATVAAATATPAPAVTPAPASMEVQVVSAVRPTVDTMTAAFRSGDAAASHAAYEAYDAAWNGIEVYVNFRSKETYDKLEGDLQHQIEEGLAAAQPDFAALADLSTQLATEWDKTIAMIRAADPIHPLFDDVAVIRMIRADLRIVTSAINAGDVAKAKTHWTTFTGAIGPAKDRIGQRTAAGLDELNAALAAADAGFGDAAATADALKPLAAAVTASYNYGLSLWNAAARNADLAKQTYTDEDVASLESLNAVSIELTHSLAAWEAGTFDVAATAAASAATAFAQVQPKLAAKNAADVTLKTALEAYAKLAAAAGDAAAVKAAGRTAHNAVHVAQHVVAGQFWSDDTLQAKIAGFPKP